MYFNILNVYLLCFLKTQVVLTHCHSLDKESFTLTLQQWGNGLQGWRKYVAIKEARKGIFVDVVFAKQ